MKSDRQPKIFPTVYNQNRKGKVYEWTVCIEKHKEDYDIVVSCGERKGSLVEHRKRITEGKAKRTSLEQAELEATRKWINKTSKDGYSEVLKEYKDHTVVRPMLAQPFDYSKYNTKRKCKIIQFPAAGQRKFDGIRCIAHREKDKIILESRKGVPFDNFTDLRKELALVFSGLNETVYLDGEIYSDNYPFEVISGLVRLSSEKATADRLSIINKLNYIIYDYVDISPSMIETPFVDRCSILDTWIDDNNSKLIKKCITVPIPALEDVKQMHDKFVSEGYEGIILRNYDAPYEIKKRSYHLQKYKEMLDEEFEIVGYHDGTGDEKGLVIWECKTKDDKKFSVRPKGDHKFRRELYNNGDKYIGVLLTVIFQEYTSDRIPRFPVGKAIRI